ncbi:MAG: HDIG domain-containing protein [Candidatus Omnitrophica bacterium]|nr:HDIG domain-containing protein [Candidatus Omnitrophota bacterium]
MSPKIKHMTWADRLLRSMIYVASFSAVIGLLVYGRSQDTWYQNFKEAEPSPRTVYAPFDFSFVNQRATEEAREKAKAAVLPVYRIDANVEKEALKNARIFFDELQAKKLEKKNKKVSFSGFTESISLSRNELAALKKENLAVWQSAFQNALAESFHTGIMDIPGKWTLMARGKNKIILVNDKNEFELATEKLVTVEDARSTLHSKLNGTFEKNKTLRNVAARMTEALILPNILPDEKAMAKRMDAAARDTGEIRVDFKKDETVVERGRRISPETYMALGVIQKRTKSKEIFRKVLSQSLIVLLLYSLLAAYLRFFEPTIGYSPKYLLLIHGLIVFNLLISKLILYFQGNCYLIPVSLASLLLVLLVKARIGFTIGFMMAALASLLAGGSLEVFLFGFFGSIMGVFGSMGICKRIQFLKAGIWVGAAQGMSIFATQLFSGTPYLEAARIGSWGLANGFLITMPLFVLFLPLLEHGFNLTTDISLLELSDLNHPLLKQMVIEAPGTYHHSLIVSHLAEEAAKTIGANALLARVGAYFHDIGKMARSEYFVENQPKKEESKHNQITPHMSYMIILSHVKKGIDFARKHKLKDVIVNFIPEHQGTGVIYFFYRKALESAGEDEFINPDDFRYPGPKPQSKETAIVMLADSSEAASRAMAVYTAEGIRELVSRIFLEKLKDGQLDECDLTLKDLGAVRENFIRSLLAVYHTRIPYPRQEDEKNPAFAASHRDQARIDGLSFH